MCTPTVPSVPPLARHTCLSPADPLPAAALPLAPFAAAAAATTPTFETVVLGDAFAATATLLVEAEAAGAPALTGAAAAATFPINLGFFAAGVGDACIFSAALEQVTSEDTRNGIYSVRGVVWLNRKA